MTHYERNRPRPQRRVVVTGLGTVSSLGPSAGELWDRLLAGWSHAHWCGGVGCEVQVKTETKATIRCIPRDIPPQSGRCIVCGGISDRRVVFARAY